GGAGGADAQADIAMLGAGVAFGHVRSAFDMTRQYVADRAARLHRRIKRIDRCARHTEGTIDPFSFQHKHGCIDCTHSGHDGSLLWNSNPFTNAIIKKWKCISLYGNKDFQRKGDNPPLSFRAATDAIVVIRGFRRDSETIMEQAKVKRGRKAAENAAPSSVQVLDRSLKLLALIAENDGSTLTDLAEESGM